MYFRDRKKTFSSQVADKVHIITQNKVDDNIIF